MNRAPRGLRHRMTHDQYKEYQAAQSAYLSAGTEANQKAGWAAVDAVLREALESVPFVASHEMPERTADTMSMAIAGSSPSGRMSKRTRNATDRKLRIALFGPTGQMPTYKRAATSVVLTNLYQAHQLRRYADAGMNARKYYKEAERLETEAAKLMEA